jgi:uncharacterized protein YqjF (DUF2071 family)
MIMHHRWENLLFLHWRFSPGEVQATLPPALTVDTFNGDAYLAITPFFMTHVRPAGFPALPWISSFQELNVRTYVYDNEGTPGVWFYSLDCNRLPAVLAARLITALRYFHAAMSATRADQTDYYCRRRGSNQTAHYIYRAIGRDREAEVQSLEFFVLERYYLFAQRRETGNLLRAQVAHAPYRYRDAELIEVSTIPAQLDGFVQLNRPPDHVCAVDGFDVNVFAPEKVPGVETAMEKCCLPGWK